MGRSDRVGHLLGQLLHTLENHGWQSNGPGLTWMGGKHGAVRQRKETRDSTACRREISHEYVLNGGGRLLTMKKAMQRQPDTNNMA